MQLRNAYWVSWIFSLYHVGFTQMCCSCSACDASKSCRCAFDAWNTTCLYTGSWKTLQWSSRKGKGKLDRKLLSELVKGRWCAKKKRQTSAMYKHPKNYPYHRMIYPLLICMWGWWRKYYATKTWINSSSVGGDFGPGAEPQLFSTPRNIYQEYQEDNSSPPKHWQQFMTEPFCTGLLSLLQSIV